MTDYRNRGMTTEGYNWKKGETVYLPWKEKQIKSSGTTNYASIVNSKYICVREATSARRGILVKAMGKIPAHHILMIGGKPFCKDDKSNLIDGKQYVSYPFPSMQELKEVLEIIRWDSTLTSAFEAERMPFNPDSSFWVCDTASRFLLPNKLQYYDAVSDQLCKAAGDDMHVRLSMAYFYKDNIEW